MSKEKALDVLKTYWGYPGFRGLQADIIAQILSGHDTIGLLPTGGGKSICYQVPGLVLPGVTLVISPLVALMSDQQKGLEDRGIKSYHFKGSYTPRKLDEAFRNIRFGQYKFAFVAPERLNSELFQEYIKHADIGLIAIDEAHCISQWGFDFRPSYLNVNILRTLKPDVPVLALTASATPKVKKDLAEALLIPNAKVFEDSIRRANLNLHIKFTPNKERQLFRLLARLEGTGIIYAKTRRSCESLAELLKNNGQSADYYHAGLLPDEKEQLQNDWLSNHLRMIVSTTAFGMGIDKSDVNWVVHWDVPDTLEGYYQEVGRGGRGGQEALAYLLFHQQDVARLQKQITDLPNPVNALEFYNRFCSRFQIAVGTGEDTTYPFSIVAMANDFRMSVPEALSYIKLLQHRGYWQFQESSQVWPALEFTSKPLQWEKLERQEGELLIQLLRLYPHAIHQPARIHLKKCAAIAMLTPEQFERRLSYFEEKGLIKYLPETSGSSITLMDPRPHKKHLHFPKSFLDSWLQSKVERAQAMLSLLESEECIFIELSKYFGQDTHVQPCGKCSRCLHDHYPDEHKVKQLISKGNTIDDIWFDLNCSVDELRKFG